MKNSLSAIGLGCALMFSSCQETKEAIQAKQEQSRSHRQEVISDSKVSITNLFVDPLNEYTEERLGVQYDLFSGDYEWNLITKYVKDNKDFMVETNNRKYPFLYTDSVTWENLKIGDTITPKVNHFSTGSSLDFSEHGLMIEDINNEDRDDPRGINFGKVVVF